MSDVEIRERILALPGFQENGKFVGEQRYRQILQFQNPPLTTKDFESSMRRALQIEKLRTALTGWMSVTDQDVAAEFRKRNEKVKLDVVPVTRRGVQEPGHRHRRGAHAVLRQGEETNTASREKRKIKYAVLNVEQVRQTITVPEAEIAAFYQQNLAQYQTPAQVRASHILFKLEGKDEKAVQATAEEVLKKAKAPARISPRSPSSTPKTTATPATAATSTTSAAAAWWRSSMPRPSR